MTEALAEGDQSQMTRDPSISAGQEPMPFESVKKHGLRDDGDRGDPGTSGEGDRVDNQPRQVVLSRPEEVPADLPAGALKEDPGYLEQAGVFEEPTPVRTNAPAEDADRALAPSSLRTWVDMRQLAVELRARDYDLQEYAPDRFLVDLREEISFDFDSATLPADASAILRQLADVLSQGRVKVTVIGYTDDRGPEEYNRLLSLRRARAVEQVLLESGLPEHRLTSRGLGEDATSDGGDEGEIRRSAQRRIEIRLEPM